MFNVAVITPIYNTQDYLHRCIRSVIGQKGVTLQYFLIDDGSTDNSRSIAQFYQRSDSRITFISKSNEGQGTARNLGIKLADAEYVYFVDSDDYLGEETLSILYKEAKANQLDICSPNVPEHYFYKPLEFVSCLPCKSQFVRLKILREFDIFQPAIRSGQDGVFSHIVLTHCRRIGMAPKATFHYTHAREGSTFAAHLKNHHLVPQLLEQHYQAIKSHYDKFDLWKNNYLRVLTFIAEESLKNRIDPHIPFLSIEEKKQSFKVLSDIAKIAYNYIDPLQIKNISPAVKMLVANDVDFILANYENNYLGKGGAIIFPKNNNAKKDNIYITKFADIKYIPINESRGVKDSLNVEVAYPEVEKHDEHDNKFIGNELKILRGKLDLAVNSINNATIQISSAIRSKAPQLSTGNHEIVVSLTTLPHRLPLVHYAIESIFSQTILPGKIILWITDKVSDKQIDRPELKLLRDRGLEIKKVEDVGPHTKLIYALESYADLNIITMDDDIVYPINTIQYLWDQHLRNPNVVISNWARELAFDSNGKVLGVRAGKLLTPPLLESEIEQPTSFLSSPNILAFPYGTSGVLYPPGCLNKQVFNVEIFKMLCPKEDDIWFKAMSLLNRTPIVVTNLGINPQHHSLTGSQAEALRHENHGMSQNTKQMRSVFEHFDLYKYLM